MMARTRKIRLTQGLFATVDDADYGRISKWTWHASRRGNVVYAARRAPRAKGKQGPTIYMHRELLGLTDPSIQVDHIDSDGLNNASDNLRRATKAQNNHNSKRRSDNISGYRGVSFDASVKKWRADIMSKGKPKFLGFSATAKAAAVVRDTAAIRLHGDFARLNFPTTAAGRET